MTARVLSWFTSKAGRRLTMGGVISVGVGLSAYSYISNRFFLDQIKEIVQLYRYAQPVPLPPQLLQRFQTVLKDMDVPAQEREIIKPFTMYGFALFHAGSTYAETGGIIGIPPNFTYSSPNNVDIANITIMNNQIDWSSTDAKNFRDSLVLSEEAQKYLIGTEVYYVRSPHMYLETVFPIVSVGFTYYVGRKLNNKLNLLQRPLILRALLYIILGMFGYGSWAFMEDYFTVYYETQADKAMCSLGKNYIEGGVEVHSKFLQRNMALRGLMGDTGKNKYTATGNNVFFLRQRHLPISFRKAYMESRLKMLETENTSSSVNSISVEKEEPPLELE